MLGLCEGTLSLGTGVAVMSCHVGAGNLSQVLCITEVGPTFGYIPRTMVYHESLVQIQCLSSVLLGVVLCVIYAECGNLSVSKQDGGQGLGRLSPGSPVWPSGFLAWAKQKPSRSLTSHVLDVREASVAHCHPHDGIRSRESSSHRTKGK